MKPKCRFVEPNTPCIAWKCAGLKDGKYHVAYAGTWFGACRRWYETHPDDKWYDITF